MAKTRPRSSSVPLQPVSTPSLSSCAAPTSTSCVQRPWLQPEVVLLTWGEKNLEGPVPQVDAVWDVRKLYDPRHSLCCGQSGTLQFNVATHASAPALFQDIYATLDRLSASSKRPIRLGFYCNRGRHRSVAVAELLLPLLQKMALRAVVHHLCLGKWACGCPGMQCWTLSTQRDPTHVFNERVRDREVAVAVVERLWTRR